MPDGRVLTGELRQHLVADQVHAAEDPMEPAVADLRLIAAPADPGREHGAT